jgi:hypothetical protein
VIARNFVVATVAPPTKMTEAVAETAAVPGAAPTPAAAPAAGAARRG